MYKMLALYDRQFPLPPRGYCLTGPFGISGEHNKANGTHPKGNWAYPSRFGHFTETMRHLKKENVFVKILAYLTSIDEHRFAP